MKRTALGILFLAIFILATSVCEAGQEMALLAGSATFNDKNDGAFTWQAEYRNNFHRNLAVSAAYLNEGHAMGRKRDGVAVQGWVVTHLLKEKLSLGLGIGPYRAYSTNCEKIEREWAAIATVAATYDLKASWFVRADWSRVEHPRNGDADLFLAGAGYRF